MTRYQPGLLPVAAALLALVSACAPAPVPDSEGGVLRLYSGGAFHGYREVSLYPNDVMQVTTAGPFDQGKRTRTKQIGQGAFQAARDHVTANPIPPAALASPDSCGDYGGEIVEMVLPDTSVKYLADCPNARLSALYQGVLAVLTPYLPPDQVPPDG